MPGNLPSSWHGLNSNGIVGGPTSSLRGGHRLDPRVPRPVGRRLMIKLPIKRENATFLLVALKSVCGLRTECSPVRYLDLPSPSSTFSVRCPRKRGQVRFSNHACPRCWLNMNPAAAGSSAGPGASDPSCALMVVSSLSADAIPAIIWRQFGNSGGSVALRAAQRSERSRVGQPPRRLTRQAGEERLAALMCNLYRPDPGLFRCGRSALTVVQGIRPFSFDQSAGLSLAGVSAIGATSLCRHRLNLTGFNLNTSGHVILRRPVSSFH
jgi:hypothetical protein